MRAHLAHRDRTSARMGTNELLNYQQLVDDGVVLLKDGGLMAGFWFEARDLEVASELEREEVRRLAQLAFGALDGNWMLHIEEVKRRQREYIGGTFREVTDLVIDEERAEGAVFLRASTVVFVTWLPPRLEQTKLAQKVLSVFDFNSEKLAHDALSLLEKQKERFGRALSSFAEALGRAVLSVTRMRSSRSNCEVLQVLNYMLNGEMRPCRPPSHGMYLDTYLSHELWNPRDHLVYGGKALVVVTVLGYPETGSVMGMLSHLNRLPIEYRWSNRFIVLDYHGSRKLFGQLAKAWGRLQRSFAAQILRDSAARVNKDAVRRMGELDEAYSNLESRTERYGHHTCAVVLRGDTIGEAREHAKLVIDALQYAGFTAYLENLNTMEAWLGTLPGHGRENLRKPSITTENLADICPLHREWGGEPYSPNPKLPPKSPPLALVRTRTGDAFHLNLHIDDLGHTLILGSPGSGKSTLLALLASQFGRYGDSQVFVFDVGYSMLPTALARKDGEHYALAHGAGLNLAPLAMIDTAPERRWAQDWLRTLFEEQNLALTASQGDALDAAVENLAQTTRDPSDRSLTALLANLQDPEMRAALRFYTSGPGAILNGDSDPLRYARFNVFELSHLMELKAPVVVPTLLYLFHAIERRLTGRPTLLMIDEAWLPFANPRFAARIAQWLVGLRKLNCAVVLSTQSPAQVVDSPVRAAVLENCKTRILLPNREANSAAVRALYAEHLQLSDEQIHLIATGRRKRQALYTANGRSRQFEIELGPVQRAILGSTGQDDLARVRALYAEHGYRFVPVLLEEQGLHRAARRWRELDRQQSKGRAA